VICPQCGGETKVLPVHSPSRVRIERVRQCLRCEAKFRTVEAYTEKWVDRRLRNTTQPGIDPDSQLTGVV